MISFEATALRNLRRLEITRSRIHDLPDAVAGKLQWLTYLDLSYNEDLRRLPASLTHMTTLETLYALGCKYLQLAVDDVDALAALPRLRELGLGDRNEKWGEAPWSAESRAVLEALAVRLSALQVDLVGRLTEYMMLREEPPQQL